MSKGREELYPSVLSKFRQDAALAMPIDSLPAPEQAVHFAMNCNGFFQLRSQNWKFEPDAIAPFDGEFTAQKVSFFGPNGTGDFFSRQQRQTELFLRAFRHPHVYKSILKFREVDENVAARVAHLFGGVVRHIGKQSGVQETTEAVEKSVAFTAKMTNLGDVRSADAIASAMGMYAISGGKMTDDIDFVKHVYHMGEAISADPVEPVETADLGLSQVARLRSFWSRVHGQKDSPLPDVSEPRKSFKGFPTVGAEFHLPPEAADEYPRFWERLALLSMSQYQKDSSIQMSRNDRDVIEIRMNPSIYPVTVANWNYMRLVLPELNQAFFTTTINRPRHNFTWTNDRALLQDLRAIGVLGYASLFDHIPRQRKREEINFGQVYLGQTVKLNDKNYTFDGNWMGNEGQYGQMGIYAGFGDSLPGSAYYLSMGLAKPDIFNQVRTKYLSRVNTLQEALNLSSKDRKAVFTILSNQIAQSAPLNSADNAGKKISELLNP